MSESTCLLSLYSFCTAVVEVFCPEYLREPNAADTERLLAINAERRFPGMHGSIDCCTGSGRTVHLLGRGSTRGM